MSFFSFRCENQPGIINTLRARASETANIINYFLAQPSERMLVYSGRAMVALGIMSMSSGVIDMGVNRGADGRTAPLVVGGLFFCIVGGVIGQLYDQPAVAQQQNGGQNDNDVDDVDDVADFAP